MCGDKYMFLCVSVMEKHCVVVEIQIDLFSDLSSASYNCVIF